MNDVTLGCLVDACVKCGKLEKAEEILLESKDNKCNTIIYTTILKGYIREKNLDKAI